MSLATHKPYVPKQRLQITSSNQKPQGAREGKIRAINSNAFNTPNKAYKIDTNIDAHSRSNSVGMRQEMRSNRRMFKSYIGSPPKISDSYAKYADTFSGYKDSPPKLSEGVYRRLYEQSVSPVNMGFYSPQLSPKAIDFRQYTDISQSFVQKELSKDHSLPSLPKREGPFLKDFRYNDYRQESLFPNTPFRKNSPEPHYFNEPAFYRSTPDGLVSTTSLQSSTVPPNFLNAVNLEEKIIAHTEVQGESSKPPEVEEIKTPPPELIQEKIRYFSPKPISPTYKSSIFSHLLEPKFPTLQDTSKMRNPMFSNFDYSKISGKDNFKASSKSYIAAEPISPKDFLKSHVTSVAQAKNYDMEQKTKIHPQLGMVAYNEEQRKTPILKSYVLDEPIRSFKPPQNPTPTYGNYMKQGPETQEIEQPKQVNYMPKEVLSDKERQRDLLRYRSSENRTQDLKILYRVERATRPMDSMSMIVSPDRNRNIFGDLRYGQNSNYRPQINYPW